MYTKRIYSPAELAAWTRRETLLFLAIAAVPVVLYEVLGQRWLHLPWLPIALIGTAVAFILSFQNNAAYGRLWEARKIWGGIVNTSRTFGAQVDTFLTNEFATAPAGDEELSAIKRGLIMRHVAWLTALRHALREPRTWESMHQHVTNREWTEWIQVREHRHELAEELADYLEPEELQKVLSLANKPAQLLARQARELRDLRTRRLVDDFRHMELSKLVKEMYTLQGRSERIKNFPYPRQYATLNTVFMWAFILLIPFGLVHEFDHIGEEFVESFPRVADVFVWLTVPFSAIVMWIFHTMDRIARVSENPFEGGPNDVPITTLSRTIEIDLRQMLGEDPATVPPPIQPTHATLT